MRVVVAFAQGWSRSTVVGILDQLGADQVDCVESAEDLDLQLELVTPHLVVSATRLADGADAVQVIQQLRLNGKLPLTSAVGIVCKERDAGSLAALAEFCADLVLVWPFEPGEVQQRLTRLMERRRELFAIYQALDDKDLDQACALVQGIGHRQPEIASEALRITSHHCLRAGLLETALGLVNEAQQLKPTGWAFVRQAQILMDYERYDDAAQLLARVVAKQPGLLMAHDVLADLRAIQGRWQEALQSALTAVGQGQPVRSRLRRIGLLALRQGDLVCAEEALSSLSSSAKDLDIEVEIGLLRVLCLQQRAPALEQAKAKLQKRLEWVEHGDWLMAWANALVEHLQSRDPDHALQTLQALANAATEQGGCLPVELLLDTIRWCLHAGLRDEGFACALALTKARRASRVELHRLRRLIDLLSGMPTNLLPRHLLQPTLVRLERRAGADDEDGAELRTALAASVVWWSARHPADTDLKALQERAGTPQAETEQA
jgi:tetratricopeptide (TPR) repeat protein